MRKNNLGGRMKFFIDRNIPIFTSPDADVWWSAFVVSGEQIREAKEKLQTE